MEIQIVLTTDNSLFARIARWLGAEWTHAALLFLALHEDSTKGHVIFAPRIIEAGFLSGVRTGLWNPQQYLRYKVFRLKGDIDPLVYHKMLSFARGQVGKRYAYDDLGIVALRILKRALVQAMLIPSGFVGEGEVCTSLVSKVFEHGGFDLRHDVAGHLLTPDDIADSELLEVIEEG